MIKKSRYKNPAINAACKISDSLTFFIGLKIYRLKMFFCSLLTQTYKRLH